MAVLVRILMLILAYGLACVAASVVFTVGTLRPHEDVLVSLAAHATPVWIVVWIGAAVIGAFAMLPSLLVIALAEGFAWRSGLLYAAFGGALALSYGFDLADFSLAPDNSPVHAREVLAAAGIAGGFVYWLIAGRKAGSWT